MSGATRGTIARLRARVAEVRASQPPVFRILDQEPGESLEAFQERVAESERGLAAVRARGGRAFMYAIQDEEARP